MSSGNRTNGAPTVNGTAPKWDPLLLCLSVMLLTYVWRFHVLFPDLGRFKPAILSTLAALALYILDKDPRRGLRRLNNPVVLLTVGLFGIMVLSVPGSLHPLASFEFLRRDFSRTLLFAMLVVGSIRAFVDVERLAAVQVVGAATYAFVLLINPLYMAMDEQLFQWSITESPWSPKLLLAMLTRGLLVEGTMNESGRIIALGSYYDNNDHSLLLVCTLPMAVYFMTKRGALLRRVAAFGAIALMLGAVVQSESRGAFLGLLAAVAYLGIAYRPVPKRIRLFGLTVLGLGFLAVGASYKSRMSTLFDLRSDYNWSGGSYTGRMEVWKRGIGYMTNRPLLGVGVAMFGTAEGRLAPRARGPDYGQGWKWSSPHNSFIEVGAELGVVGLILFVWMLGAAAKMLFRAGRSPPNGAYLGQTHVAMSQAMMAALVAFVVSGMFLSHAYTAFLYTLLGAIVGFTNLSGPVRTRHAVAPTRPTVQGPHSVSLHPSMPEARPLQRGRLPL